MYNKIFGIGLAKTGTTSLTKALNLFGFSAYHAECDILDLQDNTLNIKKNHSAFLNCQAIVGAPLCPFIDKLNDDYPNSLFIMTTRGIESWLDSCRRHLTKDLPMDVCHKRMHQLIYGSIHFDEDKFTTGFKKYNHYVRYIFNAEYKCIIDFQDADIENWKTLCKFLDVKDFNIYQPFPKENVRAVC